MTATRRMQTLTAEQREELVRVLHTRRDEIQARRRHGPDDRTLEAEADPLDAASERTSAADLSGVALHDARLVREIDDALQRVANGSYGSSEVTGEPIPYQRLLAVPWARRTVTEEDEEEERK